MGFGCDSAKRLRTQAGLHRLRRLHESGHPDKRGIWMGYQDHILEECLEKLEQNNAGVAPLTVGAGVAPLTVGRVSFGDTTATIAPLATFAGGATRSERKPDYSLVNPCAIKAIADRMTEGLKHGRLNYRQGDSDFVLETANHLLEHVLNFISGDKSDDHLNAIGANFNILCWFREHKPATFAPFDANQPHHGA